MNQPSSPDDLALATARLLSSETRLRLLRLLRAQTGGRPMCVNALACRLGVSQAAVSQHLRRFEELGLVVPRTTGVRTHYYLDEAALERCLGAISQALASPAEPADAPAPVKGSR
ncbi:MAG: helix-turn-helix transcriptional regulator [Anaerolineae bacterium]|nr:helix-turn-helix transcriptional regulator [Anaerolineae bacterium]